MDAHEEALLTHYRAAGEERRLAGEAWYTDARRQAARIARKTGVTKSQAAGVIAALSPRMRWNANVSLALAACAGVDVQGVFAANKAKAARIIAGERPLDVLGGDKVRAFYRAIMGDGDAVVLDVWMMRAAGWVKPTLTTKEYNALASALTSAAKREGINPADFQAVVWTQVRGGAE